jgi:hypothetical protein
MTVDELRPWIAKNKDALLTALLDGSYQPQPVRGVEIPKPGGGKRQLGIPTVVDRLVQQAIPGLRRGRLCKSSSRCSIRVSRLRALASARDGERMMRCSEPRSTSPTGMTSWLISTSRNCSTGSTTMS